VAVAIALGVALVVVVAAAWLYTPDRPRAELEARYLRSPADYVEVAGLRLHVRDSGPRDAPAVLLLHGFGASLQTWEGWAAILEQDHRVVRLDLPGFGLTGPDPTGDYGDERAIEVLTALLDRLGIDRASVAGNSIGGRIAWKLAALRPDRVDRLVLISPDGFASPGFAYGRKPELPVVLRLFPYVLPTFLVRTSLAPAYGDPARVTDALVAGYRDLMLAPGARAAMLARLEQSTPRDPEPLLRRVRAPTLLVWGEKDAMIPFANAKDYLKIVAGSRLVSFPTLGHVPQEEDPAASLAPVRAFLAE
jgi:pimeloyl-ACP methyl ester carboxylesterase